MKKKRTGGCSEKLCFFTINCNPFPLVYVHIAARDSRCYQSNETVQHSHSYWLASWSATNSSPLLARERSQNIENSWKKYFFFLNSLYLMNSLHPLEMPLPQCKTGRTLYNRYFLRTQLPLHAHIVHPYLLSNWSWKNIFLSETFYEVASQPEISGLKPYI